jgi:hypothetical protein
MESSLVGTRFLHSKVRAENCGNRRKTRRTGLSGGKTIAGWQNILPGLSALSFHSSAAADG